MIPIFDAHLDLAYLAACGRDMLRLGDSHLMPGEPGCGPDAPGCITLPALRASPVRACLGTIFLEPASSASRPTDVRACYAPGDAEQAVAAGLAQLRVYQQWHAQGEITIAPQGILACGPAPTLRMGLLLEGADCLREPEDIVWWHAQGVVAVGQTWAHHSRYATGNADERSLPPHNLGLLPPGQRLVPLLDALAIVHDASHLSDRALDDLLACTNARVVATHSNCRDLLPTKGGSPNQRHLTREHIREIASRGGVIGLNLFEPFLLPPGATAPARIEHALAHVLHICDVVGHARCVGLGSDMDGGFSRLRLPQGLDCPARLPALLDALLEALRARGMPDTDLHAFAHTNWERVFGAGRG